MQERQLLELMFQKLSTMEQNQEYLKQQVIQLQKQNEILRLNMISLNPMYSEEQRREAISGLMEQTENVKQEDLPGNILR